MYINGFMFKPAACEVKQAKEYHRRYTIAEAIRKTKRKLK